VGDLTKLIIESDNSGLFASWLLDSVTVDCPAMGRRWLFPCGRWLATDKDDGQLVRELLPSDLATDEYEASE
jgi:hypothetical protein